MGVPVTCEFSNLIEAKCERLNDDKLEKKMKKVIKEGGKKGVEIEGAADMGGLQFFITTVMEPEADLDMLVESMRAMNATSDPTEEERKGGSGKVGKTIFSVTDDMINIVAYVPEEHAEKCNATEWLINTVTEVLKGGSDAQQKTAAEDAKAIVKTCEGKEKNFAKVSIPKDGEKALFPLKMKDATINFGYAYLKARGLFPDAEEESDDDYCYGDDDFDGIDHTMEAVSLGPKVPEPAKELEAGLLKKTVKEGGKRGVEIEGAADMGGLKFFCTSVDTPAGDIDYLLENVKAMNAKSDPTEEERKGGSGHIGKMVFSFTEESLAIAAYVPEEYRETCKANEWLTQVIADCECGKPPVREDSTEEYALVQIVRDGSKGVFPLKIRDNVITHGLNYLKKRDLFPDGDDESDDDYCYGDEDFDM